MLDAPALVDISPVNADGQGNGWSWAPDLEPMQSLARRPAWHCAALACRLYTPPPPPLLAGGCQPAPHPPPLSPARLRRSCFSSTRRCRRRARRCTRATRGSACGAPTGCRCCRRPTSSWPRSLTGAGARAAPPETQLRAPTLRRRATVRQLRDCVRHGQLQPRHRAAVQVCEQLPGGCAGPVWRAAVGD